MFCFFEFLFFYKEDLAAYALCSCSQLPASFFLFLFPSPLWLFFFFFIFCLTFMPLCVLCLCVSVCFCDFVNSVWECQSLCVLSDTLLPIFRLYLGIIHSHHCLCCVKENETKKGIWAFCEC
ncbi:hypothetical protein BDZ91DRAFT_355100 [Kalaharituber pfeilii]|nr:hypothetical protein BDZ91DRAFT_355100 [Kalaharituber pfeilii]